MTFGQLAVTIRALPGGGLPPDRAIGPGRITPPRIVGVDGLSGAGKSGFAVRLAAELQAPVLSTDDLVPGWDGLAASVGLLTDWVLRPLRSGRPARWRRYDWLTARPGEWVTLDPGDYLVVEGCCTGLPQSASYLSYLIWIEAPAAERRRRLTRRADWLAYAPHADEWQRQEAALQVPARTADRADLIVDNTKTSSAGDWASDGFTCRPRPDGTGITVG